MDTKNNLGRNSENSFREYFALNNNGAKSEIGKNESAKLHLFGKARKVISCADDLYCDLDDSLTDYLDEFLDEIDLDELMYDYEDDYKVYESQLIIMFYREYADIMNDLYGDDEAEELYETYEDYEGYEAMKAATEYCGQMGLRFINEVGFPKFLREFREDLKEAKRLGDIDITDLPKYRKGRR